MKNVPIPSEKQFELEFLGSIHKLSNKMRWRTEKHLHPERFQNKRETYSLKSTKAPPDLKEVKELKVFHDGLCDIAKNLKYRKFRNNFHKKLKSDLRNIVSDDKVIIKADKTRNLYKSEKEEYLNFLRNNITSTYKKANKNIIDNISKKDKEVATSLDIDDRIYVTAPCEAYITLKDHKANYMNHPKFRLINRSKPEIGMVSKKMLSQIILDVKTKSQLLQWKNSDEVIAWFKQLKNKRKLKFIQFDVVDFYGSISEELLEDSLTFAARYTDIDESTKNTIKQAAQSFLYSENEFWIKKNDKTFDITMGGYHGAEICEIVGLFLLSQLSDVIPKKFIGLCRDDGLAATDAKPRQTEILKKKICKVFEKNNLRVTIEANVKIVNFLDITLDLSADIYKPYI